MSLNRELPNLMQIRAFVRVAELGSVSKASSTLYRAQSVITRAISDLEKYLGVLLFERHANGMRLTDNGACVLVRAQRVIEELSSASSLQDSAGGGAAEPLYLFQTRRLQLFVKLCETHHMQTVANQFGLSQPAVSAALKVLESGTGSRLFERTPRGLQPTRISQELLFFIRRALNELRHISADLAAMGGNLEGIVHVGALPLGRTRLLPEAIVRVLERHPNLQIVTNESPFDLLATDLRAGDIDFILGALRAEQYASDLHGEALMYEPMAILVRHDHPLLEKTLDKSHLEKAQWILPRAGSPARKLLTDCFTDAKMAPPKPAIESGDLAVIRGLLHRSNMLAAVSAHQLEYEILSGELSVLPWPLSNTSRAIGLTQRTTSLHSPGAKALMKAIRDIIQEQSRYKH